MSSNRIGFLADTHSNKSDGSDLPDAVLAAFTGCDLIVHLGDIGRKGILDRLEEVAPVWVPFGDDKGYVPHTARDGEPVKVVEAGSHTVGLVFNLTKPDKRIAVDGATLGFPDGPIEPLLVKRFKRSVDVVAYGGTHVAHDEVHDGVLFLNPGSPTLPSDGAGSVAVLDCSKKTPRATVVRL